MSDGFDRQIDDVDRIVPELFMLIGEVLTEAAAPDEPVLEYLVERLDRIIEIGKELEKRHDENPDGSYIQFRVGDTEFKMDISISVTNNN